MVVSQNLSWYNRIVKLARQAGIKETPVKRFVIIVALAVFFAHSASAQWVQASGLPVTGNVAVVTIAAIGNILLAGAYPDLTTMSGGGVYRSTDNGETWAPSNKGITCNGGCPEVYSAYSFTVSGNMLFAGTTYGVFESADSGANWTLFAQFGSGSFLVAGGTLFFGTITGDDDAIWRSTDNGVHWSIVDTTGVPVECLALLGNTVLARVLVGGVYLSNDNGITWTKTAHEGGINCFGMSGGTIFTANMGSGVSVSTDTGATWTAANNGLTDREAVSFASSNGKIFVGTDGGGVYYSTSNGANWAEFDSGLAYSGKTLHLAADSATLFAADNGSPAKVWRRPLSEAVRVIQPGRDKPSVNSFKINVAGTNMAICLPQTDAPCTVEFFTIAGKRIYSATYLVHGGILRIPLSGLSTGTYLVSAKGRNMSKSASFVVAR